jgi:hypothetical protein
MIPATTHSQRITILLFPTPRAAFKCIIPCTISTPSQTLYSLSTDPGPTSNAHMSTLIPVRHPAPPTTVRTKPLIGVPSALNYILHHPIRSNTPSFHNTGIYSPHVHSQTPRSPSRPPRTKYMLRSQRMFNISSIGSLGTCRTGNTPCDYRQVSHPACRYFRPSDNLRTLHSTCQMRSDGRLHGMERAWRRRRQCSFLPFLGLFCFCR